MYYIYTVQTLIGSKVKVRKKVTVCLDITTAVFRDFQPSESFNIIVDERQVILMFCLAHNAVIVGL